MTEVYFHCSDAEHFIVDRRGSAMDLSEAHALVVSAGLRAHGYPSVSHAPGPVPGARIVPDGKH